MMLRKISIKKESQIAKKLAAYLRAGLPLSQSVQLLQNSAKKCEQKMFFVWQSGIENGRTLAQATGDAKQKVSPGFILAADLGENSGNLAEALYNYYLQLNRKIELRKKILTTLAYPALIFCGTGLLSTSLIMFVFPKIVPVFSSLKVQLPFSTRVLMWMSRSFSQNWIWICSGIIFMGCAVFFSFNFWARGQRTIQFFLTHSPFVGKLNRAKILSEHFDHVFTLLQGGEQLSVSMWHISAITTYVEYKNVYSKAAEAVERGQLLSEFMRKNENKKLFPSNIAEIVAVGERTGNITASTHEAAQVLSEELTDHLRIMTAALEPLLMVGMSLLIGFIALSIILPIYGITTHFQNV